MAELIDNDVYKRTLANEKCNGCKWLIKFDAHKVSCLNSKACINYSEWEGKSKKK